MAEQACLNIAVMRSLRDWNANESAESCLSVSVILPSKVRSIYPDLPFQEKFHI